MGDVTIAEEATAADIIGAGKTIMEPSTVIPNLLAPSASPSPAQHINNNNVESEAETAETSASTSNETERTTEAASVALNDTPTESILDRSQTEQQGGNTSENADFDEKSSQPEHQQQSNHELNYMNSKVDSSTLDHFIDDNERNQRQQYEQPCDINGSMQYDQIDLPHNEEQQQYHHHQQQQLQQFQMLNEIQQHQQEQQLQYQMQIQHIHRQQQQQPQHIQHQHDRIFDLHQSHHNHLINNNQLQHHDHQQNQQNRLQEMDPPPPSSSSSSTTIEGGGGAAAVTDSNSDCHLSNQFDQLDHQFKLLVYKYYYYLNRGCCAPAFFNINISPHFAFGSFVLSH